MGNTELSGTLDQLSQGLADAVAAVGPSVVRVDDGSMLTASGIIWNVEGIIVTASHAVERDDELSIVLSDGTRHAATLAGRDADTDIAVLKVEGASNLTAIPRQEDDAQVRVGNIVVAVGTPGEAGLIATLGLISRKQETETAGYPEYILNTDAVLYPGISGGPLVDATGKMVGLIDRLFGRGMGVALGTPMVSRVVTTLLQHGKVPRGYLGIRTQLVNLPDSLRAALAIAQERGLLISNIEAGSSADTDGVLLGDTLLKIDNESIEDVGDLRRHLYAGKAITLTLLRAGQVVELPLTVGAAKE